MSTIVKALTLAQQILNKLFRVIFFAVKKNKEHVSN